MSSWINSRNCPSHCRKCQKRNSQIIGIFSVTSSNKHLLTFIHTTPQGSGAEERSYGSTSDSINQVEDYDLAEQTGPTAGSSAGGLSPLAHRRQYENFLAALAGKEPVRVDLETNRRSIGVITGVYESARTGKPVAL